MRKDNISDKALTISRADSSSMQIVPKNELTFTDRGRMIYGCLGIFRIERGK
ncbi:hypothetical protein DFA_08201 [Cavenderia fasciculata]|uniref:Uncharacterized protein n=1 Tax=Cavenderia fasciculata TaxID=261658 RepID=F4Q5F5_CACFS|nr:uncharacterized protein DFA_08201 [Cavenderia fasciculata]EGG17214.1 hypothetical protein DFA_08201 [Cavenderia fasciculata]|eukprot:XP_004355698.1 hypothetical protein DFA_08201 [Cavenderia fasciculata]